MRSFLLAASAITLFANLGSAQATDEAKEVPVPAIQKTDRVVTQENEAANQLFYKAFYLQNGAKKFNKAIELYGKFLRESPKSQFAPIAARNTLNLLYRTNQIDQANEFRENHKGLLARAGRKARNSGQEGRVRDRNKQGGRVRRSGNPRNAGAQLERLEKRLVDLQKKIAEARESGDMDTVEKLEGRLANLKKALKRIQESGRRGNNPGNRGPGRRNAGRRNAGRRMMKPLTKMSAEELKEHVKLMGSMIERFSDRMVDRGMEEQAKKIRDNFKKFKALVEAGKIKEAQEFQQTIFRRRRRN
jgi:tetratricopeptide (TPR) repeat protein